MKDEKAKYDWLQSFPVGTRVILNTRRETQAIVDKHLIKPLTVSLRCQEEGTHQIYYILYGNRSNIRRHE